MLRGNYSPKNLWTETAEKIDLNNEFLNVYDIFTGKNRETSNIHNKIQQKLYLLFIDLFFKVRVR
ncbi:hypothetical protein K661_01290 [Piscirickettsia salmonis LF-89 = ATCC VR-1361]|nr:hypothetical protein K661_01290 [Piscirickettsia salmonis LF-89 = ATCC VR-1361]